LGFHSLRHSKDAGRRNQGGREYGYFMSKTRPMHFYDCVMWVFSLSDPRGVHWGESVKVVIAAKGFGVGGGHFFWTWVAACGGVSHLKSEEGKTISGQRLKNQPSLLKGCTMRSRAKSVVTKKAGSGGLTGSEKRGFAGEEAWWRNGGYHRLSWKN